jgi:hypothetical protein
MLIGRYSALLDANVLHPGFLRAALLWFADDRLLRPVWSAHVLEEWRRSLLKRHQDLADAEINALQAKFTAHFPDAEVAGYEAFIPALDMIDEGDRHVLAAAIVGRCNGIITANLKHFPQEAVGQFGIEVVHPDEFIVNVIDLDESRAIEVLKRHRAAMHVTAPSVDEYLGYFERCGLIQAHQRLQGLKERL